MNNIHQATKYMLEENGDEDTETAMERSRRILSVKMAMNFENSFLPNECISISVRMGIIIQNIFTLLMAILKTSKRC